MKLTINQGDPTENGMYVVYIEHPIIEKYPDKDLLMWINGKWGYRMSDQFFRKKVYGWIGPLPAPTMEDLGKSSVKYALATMPDGIHGAFLAGPFETLDEALDVIGEEGQFIFELHLDKESVPVRKWSDKKMKWLKRRKNAHSGKNRRTRND